MKKIITISIIGLFLIFNSCTNKETEKAITTIDSAYASVQKSEIKLLSIDTAKVGEMIRYNIKSLAYIQDNFKDTATKDQGIFLSDIIAVKRSFNKLIIQQESLIDDMVYAKAQLNDLKKDVKAGIISTEDFNTYFQTEKKAIELFLISVEGLDKWHESNTKRFEKMKPKIEEFKQNLNKSNS